MGCSHLRVFLQRQGSHTKSRKAQEKMSPSGYFFQNWQDEDAWRKPGLKVAAIYSFLLSQSPSILFSMFLLTYWLWIFHLFLFSLICLLACFDRCHNNSCAEITAFKTEIEALFLIPGLFSDAQEFCICLICWHLDCLLQNKSQMFNK